MNFISFAGEGETDDATAFHQFIHLSLINVAKTPMRQVWKRMDEIYNESTEHPFVRVSEHCMNNYKYIREIPVFDDRDVFDYLGWVCQWFKNKLQSSPSAADVAVRAMGAPLLQLYDMV